MEIAPVEILYYETASERVPVREWLDSLDLGLRQTVVARLARVRRGLFGDVKPVGEGDFELKIDAGPGYRIYFGRWSLASVILLQAGTKKRQSADNVTAVGAWRDVLRRMRG